MNKLEAIQLATEIAQSLGEAHVKEAEGKIIVYPSKEGEVLYDFPVEVLNNGDTYIVVEPTGGGRGDAQRIIYLNKEINFESMF